MEEKVVDELIKWKKLLDDGVITKEEFEKQKEKLLGSQDKSIVTDKPEKKQGENLSFNKIEPTSQSIKQSKKFNLFENNVFIILSLILFAPLGLFLMWKYKKFSNISRIIITAILVFIHIIIGVKNDEKPKEKVVAEKIEQPKITTEKTEKTYNIPRTLPWNGIAIAINDYLKKNLNDPGSLKIEGCGYIYNFTNGRFGQYVKYRAKNGFGALILEESFFIMRGVGNSAYIEDVVSMDDLDLLMKSGKYKIRTKYDESGNEIN